MKTFSVLLAVLFCFISLPLFAQSDFDADLTREISLFEGKRKALVSDSMQLTERETEAFWPGFTEHQEASREVIVRRIKVVRSYIKEQKALSDEKAAFLLDELLAIEEDRLKLIKAYMKKFGKILPPRKVMRFFQLESAMEAGFYYEVIQNILPAK